MYPGLPGLSTAGAGRARPAGSPAAIHPENIVEFISFQAPHLDFRVTRPAARV